MAWHKFCPSEPDSCDGCETFPLTTDYEDCWRQAYEDGDLTSKEEEQYLAYIQEKDKEKNG